MKVTLATRAEVVCFVFLLSLSLLMPSLGWGIVWFIVILAGFITLVVDRWLRAAREIAGELFRDFERMARETEHRQREAQAKFWRDYAQARASNGAGDFFHQAGFGPKTNQPPAPDYYGRLGVARTANKTEIKKAFHAEAMKCHPDRFPGDKAKEARFKEINEAYQELGDDARRAFFDRWGVPMKR